MPSLFPTLFVFPAPFMHLFVCLLFKDNFLFHGCRCWMITDLHLLDFRFGESGTLFANKAWRDCFAVEILFSRRLPAEL